MEEALAAARDQQDGRSKELESAVTLEKEVAALKKGRHRLLEALDAQSAEVERLSALNGALLKVGSRAMDRGVLARIGVRRPCT